MRRFARSARVCLGLLCAWGSVGPLSAQTANAIRPVTLANTLPANDDSSTDTVSLNIGGANGINFFGQNFTQVYVNNNGNLTFSQSLSQYTPDGLAQGVGVPMIAPFFADVDTTGMGSGLVQYGNATINGFNAFVTNYINVGYFASETDKLNSFQVVLYDRSDTGAGNFDIEFNFNQILWETGDASGGTDGLGGTSAAVGYSNGLSGAQNVYYQFPGSLVDGALIDGGPNALTAHSLNSGVPGRYVFPVRSGSVYVLVSSVACLPGILGQNGSGTCTVTLTGNAPSGGSSVTLSSSNSSLTVPASVTVPAGVNTATFTATAAGAIASNQIATLTATLGGIAQTATIELTNAVSSGYIGVFYNSTAPSPCPSSITALCAANNTNGVQDGPIFVFVNQSGTPITNAVLTIPGVDFYNVGTVAANSAVTVIPGVSNDGQNHGDDNFFTVTGYIYDSSDNFPSLNTTQFKFTGQQGATQIQSVDICGIIAAPIFTPACTAGPSNDGTVTVPPINFLGGPGDNDGPCDNCFGPAIVAFLQNVTPGFASGATLSIGSPSTLPPAVTGVAYSQQLAATGGTSLYTWSVAGGSLPPGIGFASNGSLSGTPTKVGNFAFSAQVTDSAGNTAIASLSINVTAPALTITTPSPLPSGMVTVDYPLQVLSATGGVAPYTFTAPSNSLPTGLTLTPNGTLSGTPTVTGTFPFTLTATDANGHTGTKSLQITVRPFSADLLISTGSLSFSIAAGAVALPASQTVQVQSTDVTKTLTWSIAVSPAESWLSVTNGAKTNGATPGSFTVALNSAASSLAASTTPYQTSITLTCLAPSPCAGNTQSIAVSLLVSTVAPQLTPLTDLLPFATSATNPQQSTQSFGLQNAGGGTITFSPVTCGKSWCIPGAAPGPLGAGGTASLSVEASPAGLAPGYYFTDLTIASSAGTATVPVTYFISSNSSLALNPSGTQLSMTAGGAVAVPDTSFLAAVSSTTPVAWTAAVLPGASWLNLATTSGSSTASAPGVVTYSINQSAAAALAAGAYYGTIRVTSPSVVNSPQDFQVVLDVTAVSVKQQPNPTPAGLIFITTVGGTPAAQIDAVYASSATPIQYQASTATLDGNSWLSVTPAAGTTSASAPAQTSVAISTTGLAAGIYFGTVSYSLSAAAVRAVNVTLVVEAAGQATPASASGPALSSPAQTSSSCAPTQIVPTQTGLVSNFASPASWPTLLSVQLNDNCGNSIGNGQVVATFSNGDPPLVLGLINSSSGLYSATWTPRGTASQVTITATATAPGFTTATERISGSVVPNAAPVLALNGTLHIFNPQAGAPLAPGTIVQIYGSGLANTTLFATNPLSDTMGGTSVIVGGLEAPLFYVGSGQIDAQIPFELTAGQQYQLIVNNNGALSTPQTIQTTPVTPGLAVLPDGYVIAQHQDSSYVTDASPAKPGEYIVLYLAGMGPTTVPVSSGAASPSNPLDQTVDATTITLNSQPVPIAQQQYFFSGLAPGFTGLYQIDMQVPTTTPNGDLSLVVSQGAFQGTPVILPVHN